MSSRADKDGNNGSVTDLSRALKLFTDRHEAIKKFASRLNDDPPNGKILFFQGDGGNGKTLLVNTLHRFYCKRFSKDNWNHFKDMPFGDEGETFETHIRDAESGTYENVPSSLLDFAVSPTENLRPKDSFYGLLQMRRELSSSNLKFPTFDFACLTYLRGIGENTSERIKALFPAEEADVLVELTDALSDTPTASIIKAGINLFAKHQKEKVRDWWEKRKIDKDTLAEIESMDIQRELLPALPRFFANDLNDSMKKPNAPKRVALFFDTHEAFWGIERDAPADRHLNADKWLRDLLYHLDLEAGIIPIVSGRDLPRWADVIDDELIPNEDIEIISIGFLTFIDAKHYLSKAEIKDISLQQAIIACVSVKENEIHPFYLGLCVDVVRAIERKGEIPNPTHFTSDKADTLKIKEKKLVNRLLSLVKVDVSNSVKALSACRAFDFDIYRHLGNSLHFSCNKADFDLLLDFSFVWSIQEEGVLRYRIHDLLRRLLKESDDEEQIKGHQSLISYYLQKLSSTDEEREIVLKDLLWYSQSENSGDIKDYERIEDELSSYFQQKIDINDLALAETIYHFNQVNPDLGIIIWIKVFETALHFSRYELCRNLLNVRRDLTILSDFQLGYLSYNEGDYFSTLSSYAEAEKEYQEAINSYNKALELAPNYVNAHSNKGNVLQSLGALQAELSKTKKAEESYQLSIASINRALELASDYIDAHNNKGIVLQNLGALQAELSKTKKAEESYQLSIASINRALELASDYIDAHNNKGIVLANLGDLQAGLSKTREAEESYQLSIESYNQALELAPKYVYTHNNKGSVLQRLGALEAELSKTKKAEESYQSSIKAYDQALELAPNYINAHNNKGLCWKSWGILSYKLDDFEVANKYFCFALSEWQISLSIAPNDTQIQTLVNQLKDTMSVLGMNCEEDNS